MPTQYISQLFPDKVVNIVNGGSGLQISNNLDVLGDISTTGDINLSGTFYDEYTFPVESCLSQSSSNPIKVPESGTYSFSATSNNYISNSFKLPLIWNEGTNLIFRLQQLTISSRSGSIKWRLRWKWTNLNTTIQQSLNTATIYVNPDHSSGFYFSTDLYTISGSGKTKGSLLFWELTRMAADADDTYDDAILLHSVSIVFNPKKLTSESSS